MKAKNKEPQLEYPSRHRYDTSETWTWTTTKKDEETLLVTQRSREDGREDAGSETRRSYPK